jgi:hypothetical protein
MLISFTQLPTLFFTLITYTIHEVTHTLVQPSKWKREAKISVANECKSADRRRTK